MSMDDRTVWLTQDAPMRPGATNIEHPLRADLARITVLLMLFVVLGPLTVWRIGRPGVLQEGTGVNTFFEQYRRHEPLFLALMAVFALGVTLLVARRHEPEGALPQREQAATWGSWRVAAVALLVSIVAAVGASAVMHGYPLAMDEYVATFQSKIFAARQLSVTLPEEWHRFGWSLKPVFVSYDPRHNVWLAVYWPVYSVLRAAFVAAGADRLLNPALAACSVGLTFACARRLWPADRERQWLAVGFLALSSQFLFMSMTAYAMPAHLAANLLWTYAFVRNDRAGWLAAPPIGVVALGLHNPFPHALFVAPFLVQLLRSRRWRWIAYFAGVYGVGIGLWFWWGQTVSLRTVGASPLDAFALPGLLMLAVQSLSLTVILSWQTPLLALLLLFTAAQWRALSDMERSLAAGVLLSFLFFFFYPSTQGHGWGYRYTYPVLGSMALLGASSAPRFAEAVGRVTMRRLVMASALLTLLVQLPVRAWQVERYVRPFAQAHEYVTHLDADVVIVDPTTSWYGIDLIRNDPFLRETPKVLSAFGLSPADRVALAARYPVDRVHLLQPAELSQFGIPTYRSRFRNLVWPP
jgi:hypothetical protein